MQPVGEMSIIRNNTKELEAIGLYDGARDTTKEKHILRLAHNKNEYSVSLTRWLAYTLLLGII